MTIDLAWQSLSLEEQACIIGLIHFELFYPHTRECASCTDANTCGAIQHINDLLDAMAENSNAP